jgi:hypothetical protein
MERHANTPTTRVTLDVSPDLSGALNIDKNGDGTVDYSALPKSNGIVNFYDWSGFLQPINDTAHQKSLNLSVFKAGSTVPVKFQIKDASGVAIQAMTAPLWLSPERGALMTAPIDESTYVDAGTSGISYKWDNIGQQYIYNWNTKAFTAGYWYRISAQLDDGKIYSVIVGLR